ncbi:unnamed protein product [Heligmosomoides polygyrus]|uniref:Hydrolase n=1 Tax=Heligmosomoides polygyrus TaxID=6339 RepID=A0A183G9Y0_HELPZ|nr:unnamed protein product [Heligmosomoides polygyrus]
MPTGWVLDAVGLKYLLSGVRGQLGTRGSFVHARSFAHSPLVSARAAAVVFEAIHLLKTAPAPPSLQPQ